MERGRLIPPLPPRRVLTDACRVEAALQGLPQTIVSETGHVSDV